MGEFKGTSGKWVVSDQDSNGIYIQNERGNGAIARVYNNNPAVFDLEAMPNAKLIASAPELLDALKGMLYLFDRNLPSPSIGRECCDIAINAINKAIS